MNVQLKTHTKLKVGEIGAGKTFRLINQMKAYQVLDFSKVSEIMDPSEQLIYCVDLATGMVETFTKESEVYLCPMHSIERDEE